MAFAALRELFRAKLGNYPSSDFSSGELTSNVRLPQSEQDVKTEAQTLAEEKTEEDIEDREVDKTPSEHASLVGLNDVADELFDVPEPSDSDLAENGWPSDFGSEMYSQVLEFGLVVNDQLYLSYHSYLNQLIIIFTGHTSCGRIIME